MSCFIGTAWASIAYLLEVRAPKAPGRLGSAELENEDCTCVRMEAFPFLIITDNLVSASHHSLHVTRYHAPHSAYSPLMNLTECTNAKNWLHHIAICPSDYTGCYSCVLMKQSSRMKKFCSIIWWNGNLWGKSTYSYEECRPLGCYTVWLL
jgi:hypothetical protein